MSALTLERLDELAAYIAGPDTFLHGGWEEGSLEKQITAWSTLIDYARERAARERCEALLPEGWELKSSVGGSGRRDLYTATASYCYSLRHFRKNVGPARSCPFEMSHGPTPTEAYLALAAALEAR